MKVELGDLILTLEKVCRTQNDGQDFVDDVADSTRWLVVLFEDRKSQGDKEKDR